MAVVVAADGPYALRPDCCHRCELTRGSRRRAGHLLPRRAVPVHRQRLVGGMAVDACDVGTDRPKALRRDCRDVRQARALVMTRPGMRARHPPPRRAVPVQSQRARQDDVVVLELVVADGPDIVGRERNHAGQLLAHARRRARDDLPRGAVPVLGQREVRVPGDRSREDAGPGADGPDVGGRDCREGGQVNLVCSLRGGNRHLLPRGAVPVLGQRLAVLAADPVRANRPHVGCGQRSDRRERRRALRVRAGLLRPGRPVPELDHGPRFQGGGMSGGSTNHA
jgi:hypothetical protein